MRLPLSSLKENYKSAYRMQAQRLSDLAFAKIKEQLYKEEIPWKDIEKSSKEKISILKDTVAVSLETLGKQTFLRQVTLKSISKKEQNASEWFLATFQVTLTPQQTKFKLFRNKKGVSTSRTFSYQVLIGKTPSRPISDETIPSQAP